MKAKELPLQSIEHEAEMCRKAFKGVNVGAIVQHCHHEQWLEILTEPAENRISFILTDKLPEEQAARLRRFRSPKPSQQRKLPADLRKALQEADARWQEAYAAHKEICGCPWSKKADIFGEARS